jgi:AAA ATPase domain
MGGRCSVTENSTTPAERYRHRPMAFGVERLHIRGFRSARDVTFRPGGLCALVGEANAGKSNLLAAIRALLDPAAPPLLREDLSVGGEGTILIEAVVDGGSALTLEASPPEPPRLERRDPPPVIFLPSALRSDAVVASSPGQGPVAERTFELFRRALAEQAEETRPRSATVPAQALVRAVESCCVLGIEGVVLLIEEPELYLRPQAQRYLYRLLRTLASAGNQVIYSTHAPAFLSVGHLEELALVTQDADEGTQVVQPEPLLADESFRVMSEFDAERSELFLARAALLVEGRTEKLVFPFVFLALGHDADRQAISIVECGGKSNIPLFARICQSTGVPFVAVHDRDAEPGSEPIDAERALNKLIADVAGPERTVVLEPDFEGAAGIQGHKPEGAWRHFRSLSASDVPEPLARAAELALAQVRA